MKKIKRRMGLFLIFVMMISSTGVVFGEVGQEQKNKISEIESENKNLEKKKEEAQAEVNKLESQVADISVTLNNTNAKLASTENKIDSAEKKLKKAQEQENSQYDSMKVRIQYMYENGNTQMIDLLFNSDSITDFMDKAEYITELSEYDRNMLNELVRTKETIANTKKELETKKKELVSLQKQQKDSMNQLIALSASKQSEVDSYNGIIQQNEAAVEDLEAEIAQMEKQAAEEESRRIAEEESRKKEQQEANNGNKGTTTPVTQAPVTNTRHTGTGSYSWPLPGQHTISSNYGDTDGRSSGHNGVDIAAPAGTPIVAACSGTVEWANYSSSAGNWVGISHGGGITTVYMHMSAIAVSAGQKVSEGQTIGYVGTTGWSTGNHLHFGVRVNGAWANPWNFLK